MCSEAELAEFVDSLVAMLQAFFDGVVDNNKPELDFDDEEILRRVCAAMVHVRKHALVYTQQWPALTSAVAGAVDAAGGEPTIAHITVLRDYHRRVRVAA